MKNLSLLEEFDLTEFEFWQLGDSESDGLKLCTSIRTPFETEDMLRACIEDGRLLVYSPLTLIGVWFELGKQAMQKIVFFQGTGRPLWIADAYETNSPRNWLIPLRGT